MNFKRCLVAFIFLMFFFSYPQVFAQRFYFEAPTFSLLTQNPENASDGNLSTSAEMLKPSFISATLKLNHSGTIPAGVTTFVRVSVPGMTPENFKTILTLRPYLGWSQLNGFVVNLIAQNAQETYIAITPSEPYNSIAITYDPIGSPPQSMFVYEAFFGYAPFDCGSGWATSYTRESSAGTVNSPSTVINAINAVDADPINYSTITVQSEQNDEVKVTQTIYFASLGSPTDEIRLYLKEPSSNNRKFSKATVQAFLNDKPVTKLPFDVLGEITANRSIFPLTYMPDEPFDRLKITVSILSNANENASKSYSLEVYGAQVLPAMPALNGSPLAFCEKQSESSLSVSNPVNGLQYNWYDENNQSLQKSTLTSYIPTNLSVGPHQLKITASRPGCPESTPATVTININPKPITPNIQPIN